jgi:myo-inositol catabolism protein IolC
MLFVLAFDHRNSFRTGFFGIHGDPTPEQQSQCREAKLVILDGLMHAVNLGLPDGKAGVLVDDEYGAETVIRARQAGMTVAMPVERSGRRELEFEHDPFFESIERLRPDYVKVLVRYNPEADATMNLRQRMKLSEVQEWAAQHGMGLMLELLVPAEAGQKRRVGGEDSRYDLELRPRLTLAAVKELIAAGLSPNLWKLEGMSSRAQYVAIAAEVRSTRPDAGCLVLGRGADEAAVERWLTLAAPVSGFSGFAVGRTIWWEPLRAYYDGRVSRIEAIETISGNYRRLVRVYLQAATS